MCIHPQTSPARQVPDQVCWTTAPKSRKNARRRFEYLFPDRGLDVVPPRASASSGCHQPNPRSCETGVVVGQRCCVACPESVFPSLFHSMLACPTRDGTPATSDQASHSGPGSQRRWSFPSRVSFRLMSPSLSPGLLLFVAFFDLFSSLTQGVGMQASPGLGTPPAACSSIPPPTDRRR